MSIRMRDGRTVYECDRCGADVGLGSLRDAVSISDIDPDDDRHVIIYHLCRDREVDGEKVKGCGGRVLTRKALEKFSTERDEWLEAVKIQEDARLAAEEAAAAEARRRVEDSEDSTT